MSASGGQTNHPGASSLFRTLFGFVVTISLGAYLLWAVDVGSIAAASRKMPPGNLLVACLLLVAAFALSCLRHYLTLKAFGIALPFATAMRSNFIGILAGLAFFQLVGQTLSRSLLLRRFQVAPGAVLVTNMAERLVATVWLSVGALIAVLVLFGQFSLDVSTDVLDIAKLLVVACLALIANVAWHWNDLGPIVERRDLALHAARQAALISVPTIVVHGLTLASYVTLLNGVAPDLSLVAAVSASLIVMFSASIPISFAGWGVRELSALYAFGAIGVPPESALVVSIATGLLSLGTLITLAVITQHGGLHDQERRTT